MKPDFSPRGQFEFNWRANGDGIVKHREEFWRWLLKKGLRRRGQIMCYSAIKWALVDWAKECGYPTPERCRGLGGDKKVIEIPYTSAQIVSMLAKNIVNARQRVFVLNGLQGQLFTAETLAAKIRKYPGVTVTISAEGGLLMGYK